jgi:hypothetical protein
VPRFSSSLMGGVGNEGVQPSHNNVVRASARQRRAPEYTARKLWWSVDGGGAV